MTVHPFIEAEKAAGHNVKRACELLAVSRTAFYARRTGKPGPRAVRDAVLTQKITEVHEKSSGTYGSPRVHAVLKREGAGCGRRRVARLMRAAGLQGRHRRRRHLTTIPDPRAAMRPDPVVRVPPPWAGHPLVRRHHLHPDRGGPALSGHGHRHCLPPRGRLGHGRSSADRAGRRRVARSATFHTAIRYVRAAHPERFAIDPTRA